MRQGLKQLLKNSLTEMADRDSDVIVESVKLFASVLLSATGLLESVPNRIFGWEHSGRELMPFPFSAKPQNADDPEIGFFPQRAILLHDGLHAAAHGGTVYMYRAKGQRLYLFENGDIVPISIYAHVDRTGLFINNDYITDFQCNIASLQSTDIDWARTPFDFMLNDPNEENDVRFMCLDLIRILCHIKEPFNRAFLLEHLLTPPDVDTISEFSLTARETLWDICLSREFEDEVGLEGQKNCMNLLSAAWVPPAPQQIVSYVRQLSKSDIGVHEILARLDQFEASISGSIEKATSHLKDDNFWKRLFDELASANEAPTVGVNEVVKIEAAEAVVLEIADQFKRLIENNGLWKELWETDDKARDEKSAQNLFFLMSHSYCKANNIDLTPEADLGNGPVDFKMSHGYRSKVVVEVKLSTNTRLVHGYEKQLEIYKTADDTDVGVFLIIDVGSLGGKLKAVEKIRDDIVQAGEPASRIIYIDGKQKASASKRH